MTKVSRRIAAHYARPAAEGYSQMHLPRSQRRGAHRFASFGSFGPLFEEATSRLVARTFDKHVRCAKDSPHESLPFQFRGYCIHSFTRARRGLLVGQQSRRAARTDGGSGGESSTGGAKATGGGTSTGGAKATGGGSERPAARRRPAAERRPANSKATGGAAATGGGS